MTGERTYTPWSGVVEGWGINLSGNLLENHDRLSPTVSLLGGRDRPEGAEVAGVGLT